VAARATAWIAAVRSLSPLRPLRPLGAALGFLTRLPVTPRDLTEAELARALGWFPVAGLVVGLAAAGTAHVAGAGRPELVAVGVVALIALLTGGLHLDGVADVADGLAGGRGDPARTMAIMRDSRIGAIGATALTLVLLAKVHAIAAIVRDGAIWPLVVAPVVARWSAVVLVAGFPYARTEGLGVAFRHGVRRRDVALATAVVAVVVLVAGTLAALAAASALVTALVLAFWVHRRIGGLTGDVYGAAIEVAELAVLVVATGIAPL